MHAYSCTGTDKLRSWFSTCMQPLTPDTCKAHTISMADTLLSTYYGEKNESITPALAELRHADLHDSASLKTRGK